jgi:hypothetical protein
MKKSILIILISIISIGAQAQTYKMGPMVEKNFPYDTMEYWEADSLGKTKLVDTISFESELRIYKNKIVFKSGKNKIVYKIDNEYSFRNENLDMLLVINKKTRDNNKRKENISLCSNVDKIKKTLKWFPKVNLDQGLDMVIKYIFTNKYLVQGEGI